MDAKKKFFLFHKSQSFCSVPWNYLKINADGGVQTCVQGREKLGNVNDESINQILDNPVLRHIREDLYNDRVPHNCRGCRSLDQSAVSYNFLRHMYNEWFKTAAVDYSNFDSFHLSGLDLHWGSNCNLKCVTCWSKQSSAIAQELGLPILNLSADKSAAVIDWAISQQHQLKELYFSGGEPTLIKHNVRLLEKVEPRDDLLIRVNTNMDFDQNNPFIKLLSRFPNVLYTMSADAMQNRFDYIRQGATWNKFLKNLAFLQSRPHKFRINSVFFVASAHTLIETQCFFRDTFDITDFTINQCTMEKDQLLCRNLPDKVKMNLLDQLGLLLHDNDLSVNLQGQLSNCVAELQQDANQHDYVQYFDNIDRRRGTDWRKIFLELL